LGSRLLGGAAKLMIGQFFKSMEKQVDARVAG
jgi:carbon monoxide dehydrogenase subunit G